MISDKRLSETKDLNKLPIVEVSWRDARSAGDWSSLASQRKISTVECLSVGRLTKASTREIQIAQSVTEIGTVADTITIPRAWIKKVRRLR